MNTLRSDDLEATFPGLLAVFSADPFVSIARSGLAATNCAGGTDTSQWVVVQPRAARPI
jgi:hypothetical protein